LRQYDAVPRERRIVEYDPDLGWIPNLSSSQSALVHPCPARTPGRIRVEIFGASYSQTWPPDLERALRARRISVEVLNFACGGYSPDQALMRWRKEGRSCHPDVVLFGFNRTECENNLNMVRLLTQLDTGIPFMKPRFIATTAGDLEAINTPVPKPEEVPGILARFADWPLAAEEGFYTPSDYERLFWRRSYLLSFIESRIKGPPPSEGVNERASPAGQLTIRIISEFRKEVEAEGAAFYAIHLPTERDLSLLSANGSYPFEGFIDGIAEVAPVAESGPTLLKAAQKHALSRYFHHGHYIADLNASVVDFITNYLINTVRIGTRHTHPSTGA
jgi:hypothetical protein